jgi:hypothetical protein
VAHSVDGAKAGHGLIFAPNDASPSQQTNCYSASHFSGYKLLNSAVGSFFRTTKIIAANMNLVDNAIGFAINVVCPSDYAETEIVLRNNYIGAATISPDCPQDGNGGFCYSVGKEGIVFGGAARGGKSPHNEGMMSLRPL